MSNEASLEEYQEAYKEVIMEQEKRGFITHLVVYIIVNALLTFINLYYSPETIWFIYPVIGWGIGLVMHYLFGVRWKESEIEQRESMAEQRAKKKRAK